jgi:hypothetical protein
MNGTPLVLAANTNQNAKPHSKLCRSATDRKAYHLQPPNA